jgi:hypothetical protein
MSEIKSEPGAANRPFTVSRRTFVQTLACVTGAIGILSPTTFLGAAMPSSPAVRTGARNLITDVPGLKVGVAQDSRVRTGTTVILPDSPAIAAVDVRGGGPATRETDALGEDNLVQTLDALVLSGGSVYGLAAADGVAAWLGQQGRGYALRPAPGVPVSPIVPTACLYDLSNAGDKNWQLDPPYRQLGIEAASKAGHDFPLGTVGAGYGAMTGMGKLKGGLGWRRSWRPMALPSAHWWRSIAWGRSSPPGPVPSGRRLMKSTASLATAVPQRWRSCMARVKTGCQKNRRAAGRTPPWLASPPIWR